MIRLEMKNFNMISTEKPTKYQLYHQTIIDKYEYLTAKEILPSNQQQIIQQAKFTYSPLEKAFEKQIKIIEDQRERRVEVLKDLKNLNLKDHQKQPANDYKDKLISKEQYIFKNIYNKRLDKIKKLTEKIDDNNLVFTIINTGRKSDFIKKDDPLTFLNKIKKGEITIEEAKESQKDFINYLHMIRKGNKTQEQEKLQKNLNMLFNGRNDAINFIEGYGSTILAAKKKATEELKKQDGTGLKILTPKELLQRLPIALAQIKLVITQKIY